MEASTAPHWNLFSGLDIWTTSGVQEWVQIFMVFPLQVSRILYFGNQSDFLIHPEGSKTKGTGTNPDLFALAMHPFFPSNLELALPIALRNGRIGWKTPTPPDSHGPY